MIPAMMDGIFTIRFEGKDSGLAVHSGQKIQSPEKLGMQEFLKVLMRLAIDITSGRFIPK
jgi:hypothetical protein